jgi:hypothetical protein
MSTLPHGRNIVVNGTRYRWMAGSAKGRIIGTSGAGITVTWQALSGATAQASLLSKLWQKLDDYEQEHGSSHKVSLLPSDVRKLIEHALSKGWDTSDSKTLFKLYGPLDLTDYELLAQW